MKAEQLEKEQYRRNLLPLFQVRWELRDQNKQLQQFNYQLNAQMEEAFQKKKTTFTYNSKLWEVDFVQEMATEGNVHYTLRRQMNEGSILLCSQPEGKIV